MCRLLSVYHRNFASHWETTVQYAVYEITCEKDAFLLTALKATPLFYISLCKG